MTPSPIAPIVLSFVAVVTAGAAGPAQAQTLPQTLAQAFAAEKVTQNYPWCLLSSAFEGGENCGFATFDQCMASRLGIGGFCQINTQYQTSVAPGRWPHPAHRLHQPS